MVANTSPIYPLTPNVTCAKITTTTALVKSDGSSTGSGTDQMFNTFTAGASGSLLDKVVFLSVATAATTGVACVLRVFISTVATPTSGTTAANTSLLAEIAVPAIASASTTVATSPFEVVLNRVIPTGSYIHVSQSVAQTTNQSWQACAVGGDY